MRRLRALLFRLSGLFGKRHGDREFTAEMDSHLQLHIEDNLRSGMSLEEARRHALLKLGGLEQTKQLYRDRRSLPLLETFFQDLRFALRTLRKSPGFAAVAILTLALGIGANTAIFTFLDALLLRPLPVRDPQRLVAFSWTAQERPKYHGHSLYGDCDHPKLDCAFSMPFFNTLRAQADTFSGLTASAGPLQIDFSGNGPASMARGLFVSGDFFSTLGANMILGRLLGPADDTRSAPPAIVLDYGYWQRAFGGDRTTVGRAVRLNNTEVVIVGVVDQHFTGLAPGKPQDFFMPLSLADRVRSEWWGSNDRLSDAAIWWVIIVGRLKPEVSIAQAQAAATTIFRNEMLHGATPLSQEADAPAILLLPASQGLNGETQQIAPMFYLLMIAVGFVLLIACANVAGLLLARSAARQKEMAVRLALGAGRARIVRQLLTESVMLSLAGGALGVLIAIWGVDAVTALISSGYDQPFPFIVSPDWRILAFTLSVTVLTGILFGLAPALRGSRLDLTPALKEAPASLPVGGSHSTHWFRLGDALVVAQVALSILVLVGAGLLVRTLRNLQSQDPGFDTHNVLLFGINPTIAGYDDLKSAQLYSDLQERLASLPGVLSASYSEDALLSQNISGTDVHLEGAPPKSNVNTLTLTVGPSFFSTMRIPLLSGRSFSPQDFASAAAVNAAVTAAEKAQSKTPSSGRRSTPQISPVSASFTPVPVIVNEEFARQFFRKENPVGRHMGNRQRDEPAVGPQPGYVVVGIAGNTKYSDLRRPVSPTMYLPLVSNSAHFELRTAGDPAKLIPVVRDLVLRRDASLPLFDVRTQMEQIEQTLIQERLMTRLSSFFGLLALVLACIGLYGLLAYEVARRTREIGIRMALGAQARDVLRLVVGQGIVLVLVGAAAGIGVAIGVSRFMASILYGVRPNDPATIAGVVLLLMVIALLASFIPARRAIHVDPMVALRYE